MSCSVGILVQARTLGDIVSGSRDASFWSKGYVGPDAEVSVTEGLRVWG